MTDDGCPKVYTSSALVTARMQCKSSSVKSKLP